MHKNERSKIFPRAAFCWTKPLRGRLKEFLTRPKDFLTPSFRRGFQKESTVNKQETQKFNRYYNKYLETLTLQGYSNSTIEAYTHAIRRVAGYFDRCPDGRLSKDELKTYFADLLKTHSWSTIKHNLGQAQPQKAII